MFGAAASTPTSQALIFDSIGSVISGRVTLTDRSGNAIPQGANRGAIIISDRPGLCDAVRANPGYFGGTASEPYRALILIVPPDFLGTFAIGRGGPADALSSSEIIGALAGQAITPFTVLRGFIALTNWSDRQGDNASGSFDLLYAYPQSTGQTEFSGRFKSSVCSALNSDAVKIPGQWAPPS